METPPTISIITPTLNAARYLERALGSVSAQHDANVEHLIVDGGSSDGTADIAGAGQNVRLVHAPGANQSAAMNLGFRLSEGEIIAYLNADDTFDSGAFATIRQVLENPQIAMVMGNVRIRAENGKERINRPSTSVLDMLYWWNRDAYCFNPTGYFYRRQVQNVVGPFAESNDYDMDHDFLIRCAQKFPIQRIDRILGTFYFTGKNKTAKILKGNFFKHYFDVKEAWLPRYVEQMEPLQRKRWKICNAHFLYSTFIREKKAREQSLPADDHRRFARIRKELRSIHPGFLWAETSPTWRVPRIFARWSRTPHACDTLESGMLAGRTFRFSRGDGTTLAREFRLLNDGTLDGYQHPNEHRWRVHEGQLQFLNQEGKATTEFFYRDASSGKLLLVGYFLKPSPSLHVLTEM